MKFSLKCKVSSKIIIGREISIEKEGKTYIFIPNDKNFLYEIKIIAQVSDAKSFYSEVRSLSGQVKYEIILKRDRKIYQEIINDFQELESLLSFSANLKKIHWEKPEEECIPESEEERKKIKLSGFQSEASYPDRAQFMKIKDIRDIIMTKDRYKSLIIPMAFFREGSIEFKEFRYINAYFNFYFIVEGLYGNGKTKNKAVLAELLKSREFMVIAKKTKRNYIDGDMEYSANIKGLLGERQMPYNIESIISLIIKLRGEIHHYVGKKKSIGSPFSHNYFRHITFIVQAFALNGILMKIVEINKAEAAS